MQFINHTAHPALAFGGIDQHEESFHVVVLRQTLSWDADGQLHLVEAQSPLCEADEYVGDIALGNVLQESDLCHYKPKCDVLVVGHGHAPMDSRGHPSLAFDVRLVVKRPEAQATLIDKTLHLTGPREFIRRSAMARQLGNTIKLASLGLVGNDAWVLSAPSAASQVPLGIGNTFGGQVRVDATSPWADKVAARHHLTAAQRAAHPDAPNAPLAHAAWADNPWGTGYAPAWYLQAAAVDRIRAPQIQDPRRPVTAADFVAASQGQLQADPRLVLGLGVRPKGHPERAKLVGTVDDAFTKSNAPLPQDFKFEVWNAAWPDQQTAFLQGDEVIGLMNLCASSAPGARRDDRGNTLLRLKLPGHSAHLFVRLLSGEMFEHPMSLDTVFIEPDERRVGLVWRAIIADDPDLPVRVLEAFTLSAEQRHELRQDIERMDELFRRARRAPSHKANGGVDG